MEARFPKLHAPGRRLQHRPPAGRRPATWPSFWSAPRARSRSSPSSRLALQPIPPHRVLGVCHFPTLLRRHGRDPAHRRAGAQRGGTGRPHHDRAGPRDPAVPPRSSRARSGASRTACCWSSSPARTAPSSSRGCGTWRRCSASWASPRPWSRSPNRAAARDLGGPQGRAQHHDVDEGRRQADLLHRGLRRAAGGPGRIHRPADRGLRTPRHQRHLVRPRLGRLPARAPDPQPQAGDEVRKHARHRRGGLRDGARLQGLALRRARRRPGPLRVPRGHVRARMVRAFEDVKDSFDPRACSTRARSSAPRRWTTAACSASSPATGASPRDGAATGRTGADFAARSRCATTTAPAAKRDPAVMCPSYRVTGDEQHVTRGRANSLRLALPGQLGPDALTSPR